MPYRETDESPCHQCERPTRQVCACCNRPVCARHLEATICARCDEALYIHQKSNDGSTGLMLGLLGSAGLLVVGVWIPPLIFVGMAGLIAGPFVGLAIHKRRMRAKFFAKVRKTGALPERSTDPPQLRLDTYLAERARRGDARDS